MQQANSLLRGKPLCVAAYDSPRGCIVSPSIEAKKLGIKVGMMVMEARTISRDVIIRTPDVQMIRDVHLKFKKIFSDYSSIIVPKSIDEAIIDFEPMTRILKRDLTDIGREIKQRMRDEIGEWISCSIGIGTNRFLAKTAASLTKPNGLDVIDHNNLRDIYSRLTLTDLTGIASHFESRLNARGIYSPLQFLDANLSVLWKQVFKSVVGWYWYKKLRGWEVEDFENPRGMYGQDYALGNKTNDPEKLHAIIMKLCEKMGRRMRRDKTAAYGIHIGIIYDDYSYWHRGKKFKRDMFTTEELYEKAILVFNMKPKNSIVAKLSVGCYDLVESTRSQENLLDCIEDIIEKKKRKVTVARDCINDKFGEFTIIPGNMLGMENVVIDRIAFGGVKELEDIYK
jgi:DNA polymerase-4